MKRAFFFVIGLCLVAACNMPGTQIIQTQNTGVTEGVPEAALVPQNTPLPAEINAPIVEAPSIVSIHMLDEVHGWAFTETQLLRTNDGGVTWYDVTPPGLAQIAYSVFPEFLDVHHAWLQLPDQNNYPVAGTLYRTSDGGMTWTSSGTPFSNGEMSFLDPNNGWMMADMGAGAGSMVISVFQTKDGGDSWTQTFTNDPNVDGAGEMIPRSGMKQFITPINMNTAWIGGVVYAPGSVYLFRTDDGGKTWFHINLPLSDTLQSGDLLVDDIKFFSPTNGLLVLRELSSTNIKTLIYLSEDGGNTWTPAPTELPVGGMMDIAADQTIVLFNEDQFYISEDAGKSWNIVAPDVAFGESISSMSFANSNTGWVITTDAESHRSLYKTTDGGSTWFPIIP
jgi:photosystem II stability/assembly factor-like uncharacterized protein